jgi:uncharacterized metal-binding protein
MPNGVFHNTVNTALAVAAVPATYIMTGDLGLSLLVGSGAVLGCLLSPDLDVDAGYRGIAIIRKRSRGLSLIWKYFWWPYAKIMKHRGPSHWPIFGTMTRLAYAFPLWPLWYYAWPLTLWVWLGLAMVDVGHWFLDKLDVLLGGKL